MDRDAMTPSWRKPAGVLAILALIAVWCRRQPFGRGGRLVVAVAGDVLSGDGAGVDRAAQAVAAVDGDGAVAVGSD